MNRSAAIVSNIFLLLFLIISVASYSQPRYRSRENKLYTQEQFDSIWYSSGTYASLVIINKTDNAFNYSLTHSDKSNFLRNIKRKGKYCGKKKKKKSIELIRKDFPYNKTAAIKLVSFRLLSDTVYERELPRTNGAIDMNKMSEVIVLDKDLEELLLDILVNYDNQSEYSEIMMCYEPRNAIIFIDSNGQVVASIEICFACQQYKTDPLTLDLSHFCNEKFEAIRQVFMAAGIKYGMNPFEY